MRRVQRTVSVLAFAVCLVAAGAGLTVLVTQATPSAAKRDPAAIQAVVVRALEIDEGISELPAGATAGHLTDAEKVSLRATIRTEYGTVFAGPALANRRNGLLAWADRVATDGTESRVLWSEITAVRFDDVPLVSGDPVTVSGTYDVRAQSAWDTTTGVTVKDGGTYTNRFAMTLERRGNGNAWFVTSYSIAPVDYVPDPALGENLDINPNPGATKPPSGDDPPVVPVDPARPVP